MDPDLNQTVIYLNYAEEESRKKADIQLLSKYFKEIVIIMPNMGFGNVWLESFDINGELALRLKNQLLFSRYKLIKRVIDFVFSILLIFPVSLFFLFIGLLIKVESKGPVVIKQNRIGKDGNFFKLYKFRTMYQNADQKLEQLLAQNADLKNEYKRYRKLKNDPRVTKVGKILRRYSLDETPQLVNVLKGEMSLVGPRPYLPNELDGREDFLYHYKQVRPGMTGWWQVMARNHTSFDNRLLLDTYYISNWSLWMDFYVIIKNRMGSITR